ncbi:VAMP synaptobrevin-like protein [Phytophthora palmivora]|uniref:VAMP synaptobrevin-like protein n=1 Tax=Phytophthora palmivora TaxID=4796 RepID=A0A2P4Y8R0_9STRA|nr:VAMP synaptobrevin-like protein [Phytophthora palmivora]
MPRMDVSKTLTSSYSSNFIQAAVNPEVVTKANEKQAYVEALVLNEAVEDLDIPRECFVVSTHIGSNVVHPSNPEADDRLTKDYVQKGVEITMKELDVDTLDHVICQIPDELALSSSKHVELMEKLKATCDALETMCVNGKVQSYGFSLPNFDASSTPLEELVEKTFTPLSEQFGRFASLQLPQHVGSAIFPLPEAVMQFRKEREMLLIGDRPLEAMLSSGNPFHLKTYSDITGEDVALLLKTAFNLGIAVEKKYMEAIRPDKEHLGLPPAEEVAWAHILANQHSQFDNLQVWLYVRETQIQPRVEAIIKEFNKHKETEELGFAYSMAMNQLLKCFTGSVELMDADRAINIMSAWKAEKGLLPSDKMSIEEVAVMASLNKVIVACYMHSGGKPSRGGETEMNTFKEMLNKVIRAPTWKTQVTPNGRHSLECDPNKFHFTMNNDELVFAAITAKEYPIRLAFQMISAVQTEIVPKFGSKALTCRENGLDKDCAKAFAAIAATYDDRTKVDKLSEVMHQVDGVKTVMHNNIQVVLSNTEKMEVVEQKTNDLNEQAKVFRNTGRKLRRQMWWKNVKLTILLGVCAILVILIILAVLGVFKKSSNSDTTRLLRAL